MATHILAALEGQPVRLCQPKWWPVGKRTWQSEHCMGRL